MRQIRTRAPCRAQTPRFMTRLGQVGWEQVGLRYFFFSFLGFFVDDDDDVLSRGGVGAVGCSMAATVVFLSDGTLAIGLANVPWARGGNGSGSSPPSRFANRFLMGKELFCFVANILER